MKQMLLPGSVFALLLVLSVAWLQRQASVDPATFASFANAAALGGALLGFLSIPKARWLLGLPVAYLGWRVAFFPSLVISGHAAAISEWLLGMLSLAPVTVYPLLFLGLATGTALVVRIIYEACVATTWHRRAVFLALLILPLLISFSTSEDLRPLPDYTPWADVQALAPSQPQANVYADALASDSPALMRVPLLGAAAVTYDLIPPSPWAATVKGTLGVGYLANPTGGSLDRVLEHFQAFSGAHPTLKSPE